MDRLHHRLARADTSTPNPRRRPLVSSLTRSTPRRALDHECRSHQISRRQRLPRFVAAHRDDPLRAHLLRRKHASRPTAAIATTTTVAPEFDVGRIGANTRCRATSDTAKKLGTYAQTEVLASRLASRLPSAREVGACAPVTHCLCAHDVWYPARQCGPVLSEAANEPMTNCPGLMDVTARRRLQRCRVLMALGAGPVAALRPR